MTRRQQLFSKWRGVDSLERYNSVVAESERLSVLIIFFDEFGLVADDKPIAAHIRRLAQGGRKFGMYLIAGSQTWYSDDIASSLKANLSTSIQFYAKSKSQSRVLLGNSAAFEITRPGQAFCRLPGQAGLIELQAPDVKSVVEVTPTLLEADEMRSMPHQEPTEQEQQILELYRNGATLNGIARQVFGSIGGKQNQLIKDILSKFNEN
jgi:DNA segregation ATPase FtsK/SpoIIIE-like protein